MDAKANANLGKMINNMQEDVKPARALMHSNKTTSEDTAELIWLLREDNRILNESILVVQEELKIVTEKQNEDIIKVRIQEDESRLLLEAEMERALAHCRHTEDLKNKLEIRNNVLEGHFNEQESKIKQFEANRKDFESIIDELKSENFTLTKKLLNCEEFCSTLENGHDENQRLYQKMEGESQQMAEKLSQENNEMQIAIIEWASKCSILESENVSLKASAKLASAAGFGQTTGHPSASDYRHLQSTRSFVQTSYPQGSIPSHDTSRALFPRPTKSADYSDYKARDTSLSNTPHSHDENFFHGNVEELAALPTANFERENVKVSPSRITYKPNASLLQNSTIIKNTNPLMHFQDQNPSLFASPTPRMHGSGNNSGTIHVTGSPRSSTSPAKVRSPAREAQAAAEENVTLLGPKKLSDISRFLNK